MHPVGCRCTECFKKLENLAFDYRRREEVPRPRKMSPIQSLYTYPENPYYNFADQYGRRYYYPEPYYYPPPMRDPLKFSNYVPHKFDSYREYRHLNEGRVYPPYEVSMRYQEDSSVDNYEGLKERRFRTGRNFEWFWLKFELKIIPIFLFERI